MVNNCRLLQSLNDTEKRYRELLMKVDSLGGESGGLGNINQKAKDMKKEAEDLLNKASRGIEQLRSEYMDENMLHSSSKQTRLAGCV